MDADWGTLLKGILAVGVVGGGSVVGVSQYDNAQQHLAQMELCIEERSEMRLNCAEQVDSYEKMLRAQRAETMQFINKCIELKIEADAQ